MQPLLAQLFIGSEGTLGVITACAIALPRKPSSVQLAFLGVDSYDAGARSVARGGIARARAHSRRSRVARSPFSIALLASPRRADRPLTFLPIRTRRPRGQCLVRSQPRGKTWQRCSDD